MGGNRVVGWGVGVDGEEICRAPHVVDGAGDRTCAGTGKVGGIQMYPQDHIGRPIDLAGIGMGGDISKKTIETRHGGKGRRYYACSQARAQVAGRMRLSTLRP